MTDIELRARLRLLREEGVTSAVVSPDGSLSVVLGPLPSAPAGLPKEGRQAEPEPLHPADLIANPPEIVNVPEAS